MKSMRIATIARISAAVVEGSGRTSGEAAMDTSSPPWRASSEPEVARLPAGAAIRTSPGEIEIELLRECTRNTARNFAAYSRAGHYDGTIFHSVIPGS
ncbi:MAG: peptidylprolyl isomerase [Kiritimatiellae bacterium]|nr:peptidylprolyl isomerase [Kiritimatiellia bacterium]